MEESMIFKMSHCSCCTDLILVFWFGSSFTEVCHSGRAAGFSVSWDVTVEYRKHAIADIYSPHKCPVCLHIQ